MTTMKDEIEATEIYDLVETEDQVCAAIEAEFVSRYGDESERLWLFEGRLANIIAFDRGNGCCAGFKCEPKNGATMQEISDRLTQALHDSEFEAKTVIERYHRDYPTNMVGLKERRFPHRAVWQAAGMKRMWNTGTDGELRIVGQFAVLDCQEPGGPGHGLKIKEASGTEGHDVEEFWTRLAKCMDHSG